MIAGSPNFSRETWNRFQTAVGSFLASQDGRPALWMLTGLVGFLVSINALNVFNSYVGRDFISAIESRNRAVFIEEAWLFVGVFALSTIAAVICSYLEQRLGLLWRNWQTRQVLDSYLAHRAYYRIEDKGDLPNPDERIAEDIRSFTTTSLSFVLMIFNASFTVLAFSGVLWSISPLLLGVAIAYALLGSVLAAIVGKRLIGLNGIQLDREANFRSELIQVRDHFEPIAVLHREDDVHRRVLQRLDQLVANTRQLIAVNRNLGFFTNGYNYLIQIIPALVVAPLFMRGRIEFGVVTQAAVAFSMLMGAFSLAITQFQSISSYAAVVGRIGKLMDAIGDGEGTAPQLVIDECDEPGRLSFKGVTLRSSEGLLLINALTVTIDRNTRVLITGSSGHAKVALFRATAGLQCEGQGRIVRPGPENMMFLPERPYLFKSTLRDVLLHQSGLSSRANENATQVLSLLHLDSLVQASGGLDVERDWSNTCGIREQALLLVARVLLAKPKIVFLDRMSVALDSAQAQHVLKLLTQSHVSYLVIGRPDESPDNYDAVLDLAADGSWTWRVLTK
jgi:putative ATP-binding cassette transporter